MHKQHPQTAYRKYAVLIGNIFENCDKWTADHYYLCLWAASGIFCFPEMYNAALITTVGNGAGILLGQLLGDFIIKINAAKITPDLYINIGEE